MLPLQQEMCEQQMQNPIQEMQVPPNHRTHSSSQVLMENHFTKEVQFIQTKSMHNMDKSLQTQVKEWKT
jgi:hypothetical protein